MNEPKPTERGERPAHTPERNLEAAVEGTFPASDPLATSASQGARAVPMERMMDEGRPAQSPTGTTALRWRFQAAEDAKLALEALVRDVPIERRCASIAPEEGGAAILSVQARPDEASRIEAHLHGQARRL